MNSPSPNSRLRISTFGIGLLLGCLGFYLLMQSVTLWERPIALPGGTDGFPASVSKLFRLEWVGAGRISSLGLLNVGLYLFVLGTLFAFYWLALRKVFRAGTLEGKEARRALRIILGVAGAALFLFLWVPGSNSSDLYSYVWYGRIVTVYGDNPFIHAPIEYASRDLVGWLKLVYWKDVTSVYGPVWVSFAGAIAWVAQALGGDLSLHLLGHRLLAGISHIVNILLIWQIAGLFIERYRMDDRRRTTDDGSQANNHASRFAHHVSCLPPQAFRIAATLAYAWNPLVLIEFGANGHNDVLMLTGVLAGLWLHLKGKWRLAVLALTLASLIKVVALFWLLGYAWLLLWQPPWGDGRPRWVARLGTLAQAVSLALALWVVCYIPFWEGPATFEPLWGGPPASLFVNSIASLFRWIGGEWLHSLAISHGWRDIAVLNVEATRTLLEAPLRWVSLGIALPFMAAAIWRARTFPRMVEAWGWSMFVYLTVGAVWFWPWYVAWLLPVVVLAGPGRLFTATQIFCATSLILYGIFPGMARPFEALPFYRSLITVAPALLYVLGSWALARLRLRGGSEAPVTGGQMVIEAG
ncbi:MAG TPA: hypothetical protein VJ183_15875 [Chloroflexia bacterium]|nr:hypothetical protein [Chloroflexia bacterium]